MSGEILEVEFFHDLWHEGYFVLEFKNPISREAIKPQWLCTPL